MSVYTCPVAILTANAPEALAGVSQDIQKALEQQHIAMMKVITRQQRDLKGLRDVRDKKAARARANKSQVLNSPLAKHPRLVHKYHSQHVIDIGLAFYGATAKCGLGECQRQKLLTEFVRCSYDGKFLESIQRTHFESLKFCPIRIARVIDTSSGSINLSTIGAIREMQPGLGFREIGLLPSPSTVQRRQNVVKKHGMAHLDGCLDESELHLFRLNPKQSIPHFLSDFGYTDVDTTSTPIHIKFTADGSPLSAVTGVGGAYSAELVHVDGRLDCVQKGKLQSPAMAHPVLWGAVPDSEFDRKKYMLPFIKELRRIEEVGRIEIGEDVVDINIKWAFPADMAEHQKIIGIN